MAYTIYNNNGTVLLTLADGDVDSSTTSLDLVGKNVNNYGQYINNNLVKLLTSFANATEPASPQIGQLWFDTSKDRLKVFNGTLFKPTYGATVSADTPSTPANGDLWFNPSTNEFKIYRSDGVYDEWYAVDSRLDENGGWNGIIKPTLSIIDNDFLNEQDVTIIYSRGENIGVITTSSFDMNAEDSLTYLNTGTTSTVVAGVTLLQDLEVKGNLYVKGHTLYDRNLSINYDISSYGDPDANIINVNAGNIAIRNDLAKVFPVESISTLSQVAYALGSEVRVLCDYSGATSVRRFILEEDTPGVNLWNPYNLYYSSALGTVTNIVVV